MTYIKAVGFLFLLTLVPLTMNIIRGGGKPTNPLQSNFLFIFFVIGGCALPALLLDYDPLNFFQ